MVYNVTKAELYSSDIQINELLRSAYKIQLIKKIAVGS